MFLLDTHVLIWALEGNESKLKHSFFQLISDKKNVIYVSVVSYWEIIIKSALGKLVAPDDLVEQVSHLSLIWLNVELLHLEALKQLPPIHTDPFDRLLFAQSKATGLTFLTHDSIVKQYHINYRLP